MILDKIFTSKNNSITRERKHIYIYICDKNIENKRRYSNWNTSVLPLNEIKIKLYDKFEGLSIGTHNQ